MRSEGFDRNFGVDTAHGISWLDLRHHLKTRTPSAADKQIGRPGNNVQLNEIDDDQCHPDHVHGFCPWGDGGASQGALAVTMYTVRAWQTVGPYTLDQIPARIRGHHTALWAESEIRPCTHGDPRPAFNVS